MVESAPRLRLLLVDDHAVVRMGLGALFATVPGCQVVGEAGTVAGAVEEARRCRPDVVVMDVRLPDGSGIDACRAIRAERPEARVVMLTSYPDADFVVRSIVAGAAGYLLKRSRPAQLIEAVQQVAAGGSLLDPAVTSSVVDWVQHVGKAEAQAPDPHLRHLSAQERKVLPLLATGKTNREIAATLCLSDSTIKTYVSNILQKLSLSRRVEAAAFVARLASATGGGQGGDPDGEWSGDPAAHPFG